MHPILTQRRHLGLYLLGWLPAALLFSGMLHLAGGASWGAALALMVPACVLYAFICLASWYVVRANPVARTAPDRILVSLAAGGALSAAVWLLVVGLSLRLVFATGSGALRPLRWDWGRDLPILAAGGFLLYFLVAGFHYLFASFEEARRTERRVLELELLSRETELKLLRAQIDPHFLFNALNSIAALTHGDPDGARKMCMMLGEFFRRGMGLVGRRRVRLAEELDLARSFLAVEKIRFGERLQVREQVEPGCEERLVPPLILQPLVENAVRHGIAGRLDGGCIRLEAAEVGSALRLLVENPMDDDPSGARPGNSSGVGLENVRLRLRRLYGPDASLVAGADGGSFRVELTIPLDEGRDGS
jgi:two-component system, LytTR family, sensor histidine kinase AlgZ